jgi:predicted nucleic-acid-binding Zn-ribbon protein
MCPFRLHSHYERTCRACGYTWVVSRAEAAAHPPTISRLDAIGEAKALSRVEGLAGAMHDVDAEEDARLETYEEMRRCPACGVDDFSERPIKASESTPHSEEHDQGTGPSTGTLSPDGTQFWSGTAWVPATLKDGSRWDGTHWVIPEG